MSIVWNRKDKVGGDGIQKGVCLSTDTKPTDVSPLSELTDENGTTQRFNGVSWNNTVTAGASLTLDAFRPSSYAADLTMNGTAQAVALATGATRVRIYNQGATTESIRFAFGTDAADAQANLAIVAAAATTGILIPAQADNAAQCVQLIGVPALATYFAVANAVAADVQVVNIIQGA